MRYILINDIVANTNLVALWAIILNKYNLLCNRSTLMGSAFNLDKGNGSDFSLILAIKWGP